MIFDDFTESMLLGAKEVFKNKPIEIRWYVMSCRILMHAFGKNWLFKNVLSEGVTENEFFKLEENSEISRYINQNRIIRLGHMLYALRNISGFDHFVESIKRRDIEPAYFELTVANMLCEDGYNIRFVNESGIKTQDYDLLCSVDDIQFCVESKSRRYSEVFNTKILLNALKKAKGQLPKTKPGVIFILISDSWLHNKSAEAIVTECVVNYLRTTERVNKVILIWDIFFESNDKKITSYIYLEINNNKTRFSIPVNKLLVPLDNPIDALNRNVDDQIFKPSFEV